MISINEAFNILQDNLPEPALETVDLSQAWRRYLAEDILAPEPSPRYTNSAMDGYAVRWQDVMGTTPDQPTLLTTVGESKAGVPFAGTVQACQAVRISTGAVLPEGADTVIRVEDTREERDRVAVLSVRGRGQDIRRRGEEFQTGELLLNRGIQLRTRQLALLAAVGIHQVPVYATPRIRLLVTGTELVSSNSESIKPYQIRDSNRIMLTSACRDAGGLVLGCDHVGDDLERTVAALEQAAAEEPDCLLCSGGVSVGRHDHVKRAADLAGFQELFWRIRQKPGKPLFAARRKNTLLFGLPGNPVSAFMCFVHYVRPVIAHLQGRSMAHPSITARAPEEIRNTGKRTNFLRVRLKYEPGEIPQIVEMNKQGSHMLSSITHADGYIGLEPGEILSPGSLKEVFLL